MMIRQGEQLFDPEQGSSVRGSKYGSIFCMRHKLEGIRIINEKLSHPTQCVSDETIIAVCHLIGLEVRVAPTWITPSTINTNCVIVFLDGKDSTCIYSNTLNI